LRSLSGWVQIAVPEVDGKKLSRIARLTPDFAAGEGDAIDDLGAVAKEMRIRIWQNFMPVTATNDSSFSLKISGAAGVSGNVDVSYANRITDREPLDDGI
jgi:hypothetical protein